MPLNLFTIDGGGLEIENYIYMYHLQEFIVLPSFVDSVQENFQINWAPTTPLGRSAPIYSFQNAGPRTIQVTFTLHRDMMWQINKQVSNATVELGDDYVDTLIKDLQACVLPDYDGTSKAVNPPVIAMRIGDDIFIKGVITNGLGYTWNYPILANGKYSNLSISFTVSEIDPYDARLVRRIGSYRNVSTTLDYSNVYDVNESPEPGSPSNLLSREEFVREVRRIGGRYDFNTLYRMWLEYQKDPDNFTITIPLGDGTVATIIFNDVINQPSVQGQDNNVDPEAANSGTAPQTIKSGAGENTNEVM